MNNNLRILVVAGSFDSEQGKKSGLIDKMFNSMPQAEIHNGGNYSELNEILNSVMNFDVVFWFANVDNSLPKIRNVKDINPRCLLITSKRNDDNKYCFEELINRALGLKANLCFEFSKTENGVIAIRVFDPLGVVWCDKTSNYEVVMEIVYKRLMVLASFTRQSTKMVDEKVPFEVENKFLDIIHEKAEVFHNLIQPPEVVNRFLGNVSFRCVHGFPSYRGNNQIIVSRRNVNKSGITNNDFVPVQLINGVLYAYGDIKPSVDTPVQARLYEWFPQINFMLHSHVYIKGAPFTAEPIPCGAIEEVESIMQAVKTHYIDTSKSFCVNLLGHGNLVFATELDYFNTIEYIKRDIPEMLNV